MYFDKNNFKMMVSILFNIKKSGNLAGVLELFIIWLIFPISISVCFLGSVKIGQKGDGKND